MDSNPVSLTSPRRTRRRWRVPPAIMHGPEPLESAGVLDELPGATGLVLWQSLRDVTLWAGTPPQEREGLFSACSERKRIATLLSAGFEPELEQPLGLITAMVGRPGKISTERVALACRRVAQWAEGRGRLATALAFAQAAALVCPGDAAAGYKVGQLARKRAEYARAETWFRRAIALARQEGDWNSYALGFSGLGNLYIQRGNFPKARVLHTRALRAARRHSLRGIQGDALHDLLAIAIMTGDPASAHIYASRAFEVYGPTHAKIPVLAQDTAYFWLTQGLFVPALRVFQSLRRHVGRSIEWVVLLPNIARAAGGAGDRALYEEVWEEVWPVVAQEPAGNRYAEASVELARGAASLGQWSRAELAAERAMQIARDRQEARVELEAEAVLQSVQNERSVARCYPVAESSLSTVASFADDLVESLNEVAAAS